MTDALPQFTPITDARPQDSAWPAMSWPPPPGVKLTGVVVELTPRNVERDAQSLRQALDHDEVWRHIPGPRPGDDDGWASALSDRLPEGRFVWTVRLRTPIGGLSAGTVVGTSAYLDVSVHDARLEIGATAYTPAVWATKVNPDAKLQLLSYAFDTLRTGRVQLKTDVRNTRSQAAIARLGARYEGTLRRYQRRDDGSVRDTVLFSIVAEDWPRVRAGLEARVNA